MSLPKQSIKESGNHRKVKYLTPWAVSLVQMLFICQKKRYFWCLSFAFIFSFQFILSENLMWKTFGVDGFIGVQRHDGRIPQLLLHDTDRHLCSAQSVHRKMQCRHKGSALLQETNLHCHNFSNELSAGLVTHFQGQPWCKCMFIIKCTLSSIVEINFNSSCRPQPYSRLCLHHPHHMTAPSTAHLVFIIRVAIIPIFQQSIKVQSSKLAELIIENGQMGMMRLDKDG